MKKILSKGKVIVSLVSIFAILAVSLLSMFTGISFVALAEDEETSGGSVTYPLNGKYDADYVEVTTPGISYEDVDFDKKTETDTFTGYDYTFCVNPDTEGNGTAGNPFIIKTANQFAAVVTGNLKDANGNWMSTEGLCFKIADNIYGFNLKNTGSAVDFSKDDLTAADVEAALKDEAVPTQLKWEQKSGKPFMGRFDGNGACVYGLKADSGYAAIFPKIGGNIDVKNLTVKNCYFIGSNVSAFFGANSNPGVGNTTYNTKHYMYNCQAYNNVLVCTFNTDEAIQKCGVIIGQTEWPTESNLVMSDCLVYGNIAKHATRNITYSIVGNLHRTGSLTINNCIVMDTAPHALYYGSNAHLTSSYYNLYTDMMGFDWENVDVNKNGATITYKYSYRVNSGTVSVGFNHFDANGTNLTNGGNGYLRDVNGVTYLTTNEDVIGATALEGIDPEKWTYNEGGYPTPKIYKIREYSKGTPWSGEISVQFAEGDGSDKAPYTVSTAEDLVLMLTSGQAGKYYKLTADIMINDTTVANWTENAKTWFTSNDIPTFEASLDGNGYTISGIYYDGKQAGEYAGLIPVIGNTANITNLTIADSVIKANDGFAGAVAGAVAEKCSKVVKFSGVTIEDSVKFEGKAKFGGMIGKVGYSAVTIADCISKTNGFFDSVTGEAKVKRSVSVGAYPFANTERVKAENVYTDTEGAELEGVQVVPNDAMLGNAATSSMPGLNFPTSWAVTAGYPAPTGVAASAEGVVGEPWSGAIATKYASGTGTEADPYIIETPEQLALLVSTSYKPGGGADNIRYYKLAADIYVNDVHSELWQEKIGCLDWFSQWVNGKYITNSHINLDGDGHVIFGLYYDHTQGAIEYVRVGLFPVLSQYSTIQNLGLSDVYFVGMSLPSTDPNSIQDSMAAFVGCIEDHDKDMAFDSHDAEGNKLKLEDEEIDYESQALKIKNCFVDHRSYISAFYTGGFVGSPYAAPIIENCIFTGSIGGHADQYFTGMFTGCDSTYGSQIRNSIAFPMTVGVKLIGGSGGASWRSSRVYWVTHVTNTYHFTTASQYGADFLKVTNPNDRLGDVAQEAMPLLDWENTWRTVDEGTPVLRVFDKHRTDAEVNDPNNKRVSVSADYFSMVGVAAPNTTLTFSTGDPDITVPKVVAPMYSTLSPLPTITRPGYEFLGWYVFEDPAIPYDLGYHPARDLTLHAGWAKKGVTQDFENYTDTFWDYDSEYWTLNKPGAKGGYKVEYFRTGSKSMHLLGTSAEPVDCLLNYEQMLEPGKSYTMTFWVNTDKENNPATLLSLVHNSKPDYLDSAVAVENMAVVTGLKVGEWVQYSYSFTAQTKWVSLRATGGASLWFDDIVMAELDDTLEGGKFVSLGTNGAAGGSLSPNTSDTVSVAALISAIMACAVIAVVSRKNLVEVVED